jgi:hypothetical protein
MMNKEFKKKKSFGAKWDWLVVLIDVVVLDWA